ADVLDEDVADRLELRRPVERAGRDADRTALQPLPEQARAAFLAEAATGEAGRAVPFQAAITGDGDVLGGGIRIGAVVAVEFAALAAVTIDDCAQWPAHFVADGAAETAADPCRLLLPRRLGRCSGSRLPSRPSHGVWSSPCELVRVH